MQLETKHKATANRLKAEHKASLDAAKPAAKSAGGRAAPGDAEGLRDRITTLEADLDAEKSVHLLADGQVQLLRA